MKKISKYLIFTGVLTLLTFFIATAQYKLLITQSQLEVGDTARVFVAGHSGDIQWEKSFNLVQWSDIPGEVTDSLVYIVDTSLYLRGRITEGTCSPLYSDTLHITVFVCGISTVADYEGSIYNTVQIGDQCWMKENMKTNHYADGTELIDGTNAGNVNNDFTTRYWFAYNNDTINKQAYGLLYTWAAVMNGAASSNANPSGVQGICPDSWHVPSDNEWMQLELFLGMNQSMLTYNGYRGTTEGGKLKESEYTYWNYPNTGANNQSHFTARGGGIRVDSTFYGIKAEGQWWTSTQWGPNDSNLRQLLYDHEDIARYQVIKWEGSSVRCIKN